MPRLLLSRDVYLAHGAHASVGMCVNDRLMQIQADLLGVQVGAAPSAATPRPTPSRGFFFFLVRMRCITNVVAVTGARAQRPFRRAFSAPLARFPACRWIGRRWWRPPRSVPPSP
eukprot:COSAG01_NODE_9251_length_2504_cov_2.227027_3_plen_115_part_00